MDSEIWPIQLSVFWQDQAGQKHMLLRPIDGTLCNLDDPVKGPVAFPIESYGQGETAQISKQAHDNPIALLSYLDRFVEISEPVIEENGARDELLELQTEIEKATKNVELIPQHERALATTQQQLGALEQAKAKDVIELQRKLAAEREVRSQIEIKMTKIEQGLDTLLPKAIIDEIEGLADPSTFAVGGVPRLCGYEPEPKRDTFRFRRDSASVTACK